jgi:hypothetical protein
MILTQVFKEVNCNHYNKQILESGSKGKAIWKIVQKETRKYSSEEMTPSIKINDDVQKLLNSANSSSTYFLTVTEINTDTTTLTT